MGRNPKLTAQLILIKTAIAITVPWKHQHARAGKMISSCTLTRRYSDSTVLRKEVSREHYQKVTVNLLTLAFFN